MSSSSCLYLATACTAAITASAFQSTLPFISHTSRDTCHPPSSPRTHISMSYHPNYGPYDYYYPEQYPPYNNNARKWPSSHPLFSTSAEQALDQAVDAQVVFDDEPFNEEEWIPDRDRKQGEVINFDPENPKSRPLKNAAAPNDHHRDNHFRKNPTAYNDMDGRIHVDEYEGRDLSQLHSETRHMNEEYYTQRQTVRRPPTPTGRRGPQVYTREEEELINAMGGRRNTQDFAGTRTPNGREFDERRSYGRPMDPMPPFGDFREDGYLGDSTLKEIAMDFSIPICYLADVVASWGVPVPIDPLGRLGDMVTGEQAFAMLEAIHTLDIAALHDRYSDDNLMSICDYYELDLKEAFDFAMKRGWALPFGVRTFLRVDQEDELLDALGGEMMY